VKGNVYIILFLGKDSYTIIINKDLNVWGSYFYKEANDVAHVSVPVTTAADSLEALSMVLHAERQRCCFEHGWDK
jgi:hypothetical protein